MKTPRKVTGTVFVPATEYNDLVTVVDWLMRNAIVAAGDGLEAVPLGRGRGITAIGGSDGSFWARITAYDLESGIPGFWKYGWEEVVPPTNPVNSWTVQGRSGTTTENPAHNSIESLHIYNGMHGIGIDTGDMPGTYAVQPAPASVVVRMYITEGQYWFQYENSVNGECEEV
jgi:hypothetical protein